MSLTAAFSLDQQPGTADSIGWTNEEKSTTERPKLREEEDYEEDSVPVIAELVDDNAIYCRPLSPDNPHQQEQ